MSEPETDADDLSSILAEATGSTVEEIEAGAAEFEMVDPVDAEWEYLTDE